MNTKERILQLLQVLNIGQSAFEKKAGISNGYINNNKGSIGSDVLLKILSAFPDINVEWLISGSGEMLKSVSVKQRTTGDNSSIMGGSVNGDNNTFNKNDYHQGLTHDDFVGMMEERFQHMLKKEDDIHDIVEENHKLTDELMRKSEEFRKKNDDYRNAIQHIHSLTQRIEFLTDKLLEK